MKTIFGKNFLVFLLVLFCTFSIKDSFAVERTVVDPWTLEKYLKGDEIPPDDVLLFLRIVTVAPEGSCWYNFITQDLVQSIQAITNDLLDVKLYAGGVLGDEADTIRKMRMRQIHAVGVTNMGATMMVPELCVLELPFLFDYEPDLYWSGKYTEIDYILEKIEPSFCKLAAKHGYQFAGMAETCFNFIGSKIPLRKAEDLKKINFWLWRGDRIRPEVLKAMKFGNVLTSDLYSVAQAYSTNMVDSTWLGYNPAILLQWWPHIRYATDYPIFGYESATAFFDKKMIEIVIEFAEKWGEKYKIKDHKNIRKNLISMLDVLISGKMRFLIREQEGIARQSLFKEGIQEVAMPKEELDKLRSLVEPLYFKLADKKYPKSLIEEILKYRQEYRKLKADGTLTDEWFVKGIVPGDPHNQWHTW